MKRNLSMGVYFNQLAAKHTPKYRFNGSTQKDWQQWRKELLPELLATMGQQRTRVPLNPEVQGQWNEDGLIKQKVVFDVEDGLSATAYVFRPEDAKGPLPAILACHGHGPHGKEVIMGNGNASGDALSSMTRHNYSFGLQMAKAGYVTMAIDWRGFGERDVRNKPNWYNNVGTWDPCNLYYLLATMLNTTVMAMNVNDGKCALDYLCEQDFVDADRLGVMGISFGGVMTIWMTLCDQRIKASDVICHSDRFADFGYRDLNFCGSQITPGEYSLCDVPDLQGLIAPQPLLVEIGAYDDVFKVDSAMNCFHEVEKIYTAAGARDKLDLDIFEGGHSWSGRKSPAFFDKYLKGL